MKSSLNNLLFLYLNKGLTVVLPDISALLNTTYLPDSTLKVMVPSEEMI